VNLDAGVTIPEGTRPLSCTLSCQHRANRLCSFTLPILLQGHMCSVLYLPTLSRSGARHCYLFMPPRCCDGLFPISLAMYGFYRAAAAPFSNLISRQRMSPCLRMSQVGYSDTHIRSFSRGRYNPMIHMTTHELGNTTASEVYIETLRSIHEDIRHCRERQCGFWMDG
jgi:hypothetical protein